MNDTTTFTLSIQQLTSLVEGLTSISGVQSATLWAKAPGKERIYVGLTKHNGGKDWNSGLGHKLVIHSDGKVEFDKYFSWAGAATRDWHTEAGTLDAIKACVGAAILKASISI